MGSDRGMGPIEAFTARHSEQRLQQRCEMPVGDLKSDARGSGARYNEGKNPLDLVPAAIWEMAFVDAELPELERVANYLRRIQEFARGGDTVPHFEYSIDDLEQAARVFEHGISKYAAWNWAKGMAWSVPMGCALRHCIKIAKGEELDSDSGLPHWGHVICNVIMIDWFVAHYQEGDDVAIPLCQKL